MAVTQVRPMGEVQGTCPGPVTTCRGWGEFGQDGTWGQRVVSGGGTWGVCGGPGTAGIFQVTCPLLTTESPS